MPAGFASLGVAVPNELNDDSDEAAGTHGDSGQGQLSMPGPVPVLWPVELESLVQRFQKDKKS